MQNDFLKKKIEMLKGEVQNVPYIPVPDPLGLLPTEVVLEPDLLIEEPKPEELLEE